MCQFIKSSSGVPFNSKHVQVHNPNSDSHIFFSGWPVCFGESQASNYPDEELDQRSNVTAYVDLALFSLETKVQETEEKLLIVCTTLSPV